MILQDIIDDIKLMLGAGVVKLEIGDTEIEGLVRIAIRRVTPHISDTKYITKPALHAISLAEDNVSEVIRVIPGYGVYSGTQGSTETTFDWTMYRVGRDIYEDKVSLLRNAVEPDYSIPFEYDSDSKVLMISEGYVTGNITIEALPEKYNLEDIKDTRVQKWIHSYTLALAKEVVGRIRSKVKSSNVPIELDGDTLLSEASSEKAVLESSLETDQFGPVDIIR